MFPIIIIVEHCLCFRARRRRDEIPVDKMGLVVAASFPDDTSSQVDISNPVFTDPDSAAFDEPNISIPEKQ